MTIRDLAVADVSWAAELMESRRQVYASYSPVFWRPAVGVTGAHARFLRRLVADPSNAALRSDHGFIIGQRRHTECFVDDFAVDDDGTWTGEGRELLGAVWARTADVTTGMRVVTAKADRDKAAMLGAAGLTCCEQYWVKPLDSAGGSDNLSGRVEGTGFSGLLGPAPPVYDPGGPVLLVDHLDHDADLASVESSMASMGAVLGVIPVAIEDDRSHDLERGRWTVASQWYVGQPQPVQ